MIIRKDARCLFCLCKVRIALFASLSAVSGLVLAANPTPAKFLALFTGVFLLACGACALNQYQEKDIDALMPRTGGRPIPSGRIGSQSALYLSLVLIYSGFAILLCAGPLLLPVLGLGAVLWYNGVYTWLKKKSAFAAVPGALVGAIPPAMGWVAGGSDLSDPRLTALCFFFFMWQVPHFWLHLMTCGREYSEAGLPSLTAIFSNNQMGRLIFHWISATAVGALLLCLYGLLQTLVAQVALVGASLWLLYDAVKLLWASDADCRWAFRVVNVYMLIVILLVFFDTGLMTSQMIY